MRIFWDSEFTGLHQNTTLISIGFVTESNHTFYGECTDFDPKQVDEWVEKNVLSNLLFMKWMPTTQTITPTVTMPYEHVSKKSTEVCGTSKHIVNYLEKWLQQFKPVQLWGDVCNYDWVLLSELWGGGMNIPKWLSYAPGDISTLFYLAGLDPIHNNREDFAGVKSKDKKHNALWDAIIAKRNYEKLIKMVKK